MTSPYSVAFKQKMIHRLTGKNALSASQLAKETGVRQQNLSRLLEEARSLPVVTADKRIVREWTVEQKARVLAEASKFAGEQLIAYLEREGVKLAHFERWRPDKGPEDCRYDQLEVTPAYELERVFGARDSRGS